MADNELFLVTGATGNTGAPTVKILRDAGRRVRALVHTADERADELAALGAEVVVADLLDLHSTSSALAGVSAAYFCFPIAPGALLTATTIFAQAASEAGVKAVVNMSQISARREAKSHAAQQHWLAERLLDRSAFITTHLRPTFFAEWLRWTWLRNEDGGVLQLPFGDGRHAPIAGSDQAKVIAAILQNPAPHDRQIYPLFGAQELNHHEIAAQIAGELGIPVRYESLDIPTFDAAMAANGRADFFIQHLSNVAQDYRDGIFAGENNLVEVIGGSKPLSVPEYVRANRAAFDHDGPFSLRKELPQR
ncbi:uncharacterized protein YbjT (DUF2867 family) [Mycolicibacterium sp. BK556]|uniref:NmrA family NAD(P)-binding protein n=1 Tax=unclassified Mycolicibacterium TaxID=2636767 RepID=UPI001610C1A9|nr:MULTISPECIES: NmrA family NAD(P)-binding protein [unclassified Mycolicibacterium]MBB3604734.1 uncharacterized protein YbjT (DUF2867 family) [Mycolicibacterium sp. BK556]MBB3634553.1 uncharacterized protein YbjT (DUF2867 family) [Mycolicibacterium sp. BK607]